MKRLDAVRRVFLPTFGVLATAFLLMGADEPKQTIDAKGLTFEAPKAWKSSPPTSEMRRAQLKVEPIEGDDYPAELIVFAFRGAAGSVEANLERWQKLLQRRRRKSAQNREQESSGKER